MKKLFKILTDCLRVAKKPEDYSNAYRRLCKSADLEVEEYMGKANIHMACGDCSFCCYQWVRVLAHEVFAIVDYIRDTMPVKTRETVVEQMFSYHAKTADLTEDEKNRSETTQACPLLVRGRCSVYPVRPLNCRRFHSLDSSFCEGCIKEPHRWRNTPRHEGLKQLWNDMIYETDYFYFTTGHDQTTYDLVPACLAALSNPECRRRWVGKKKALLIYDS